MRTYSLDDLSRYFGNEAVARGLLSNLKVKIDTTTRYSEETLQAMRRLRVKPVEAVPPPARWISLEAAGKQLEMEPGKVFIIAERGELRGELFSRGQWRHSMILESSIADYRARQRQEALKLVVVPQMPQGKPEPILLPPAPTWETSHA